MAELLTWFPIAVYSASEVISEESNRSLIDKVYEFENKFPSGGEDWEGNTYTTHDRHNLVKEDGFQGLIEVITEHVNLFAKAHNSNAVFKANTGWANIAKKGAYQEFHYHANSIFSAVYYPIVPENSGKIVFENPILDMYPIPKIKDRNELSYMQVGYTPKARDLIIFRSYMRHLVKSGTNSTDRMSIAFNFLEDE